MDQYAAVLWEQVAEEYQAFHAKGGLTLRGLRQTYDDGIGDVDIDYDTLGLGERVGFHMKLLAAIVCRPLPPPCMYSIQPLPGSGLSMNFLHIRCINPQEGEAQDGMERGGSEASGADTARN